MLNPYRQVRFLRPDTILWAPGLRSLELTGVDPVLAPLRTLLPRLRAGQGPAGPEEMVAYHLLMAQGYLSSEKPCAPWEFDASTNQAVHLHDSFSPKDLKRAKPCETQLQCHAFSGDEEQGWVYSFRPGLDPCFHCFLRRWLASLPCQTALQAVWSEEVCLRWRPVRPLAERNRLLRLSAERPGQALMVQPATETWLSFLPRPGCGCCPFPKSVEEKFWCGQELGIVKQVATWREEAPVVVGAHNGEPLWVTGTPGYSQGAGCGWSEEVARGAAVGESLERYAASHVPKGAVWDVAAPGELPSLFVDAQYRQTNFPYRKPLAGESLPWLPITSVTGEHRSRAPLNLLLLRREGLPGEPNHYPEVSHGLACSKTLKRAIEGGMREVLERDALTRFWGRLMVGLAEAREVSIEPAGQDLELTVLEVPCLGDYHCVIVFGRDPQGRISSGSAVSADLDQASEKAKLECHHNRAIRLRWPPSTPTAEIPHSFEEHGEYYWHYPEKFPWGPLTESLRPSLPQNIQAVPEAYYADLTTEDVAAAGFRVARVLIPGLLPLPVSHHAWPLGLDRWKGEVGTATPRLPHPFD